MNRNVLVYISGPMTAKDGRTIEQNTADGVAVYLELLKRGIPAFSPHLSGAFPSAWSALDHAQWIEYDLAIIDRCTHVLMMARWETSTGARLELAYADQRRIPICFTLEELDAQIARMGRAMSGGQMEEHDRKDEQPTTDQGDGTTSEKVTNEQAQDLVDSGEATPGPGTTDEKEPAPV